jgi:hypothetical protein
MGFPKSVNGFWMVLIPMLSEGICGILGYIVDIYFSKYTYGNP